MILVSENDLAMGQENFHDQFYTSEVDYEEQANFELKKTEMTVIHPTMYLHTYLSISPMATHFDLTVLRYCA